MDDAFREAVPGAIWTGPWVRADGGFHRAENTKADSSVSTADAVALALRRRAKRESGDVSYVIALADTTAERPEVPRSINRDP